MSQAAITPLTNQKHTSRGGRRFGWRPDLPDRRDHLYRIMHPRKVPTPPKISYRDRIPYRFDQGDSSSCTGQSGCYMVGFEKGVTTLEDAYSRLFYYYNERELEGDVKEDAGASIRDGIKLLASKGICKEKTWPFDLSKMFDKPPLEAYQEAAQVVPKSYSRLLTREDFRQCLAKGFIFTIGITCYSSIDSDVLMKTGVMQMPGPDEAVEGGHAVTIIGYDTDFYNNPVFLKSGLDQKHVSSDMYEVVNSWGRDFGDDGCFWIPAAYLENEDMAQDAWYTDF